MISAMRHLCMAVHQGARSSRTRLTGRDDWTLSPMKNSRRRLVRRCQRYATICAQTEARRCYAVRTAPLGPSVISPLQSREIELFHLQQRFHNPIALGGVSILQHIEKCDRNDLPGQAIFVLEPAALARCLVAPLPQTLPVVIDFRL